MSDDWVVRYDGRQATFSGRDEREISAAIWRPAERRLSLTREQTGRVPLFYARTVSGELVASPDLGLLLRERGEEVAPNREVAAAWLAGAPIGPRETLLAGVSRVPAGHVLELAAEGEKLERWWTPPAPGSIPDGDASRFGEVLEAAVGRAIEARHSSVFLSGGIDSGTVAAAAGVVAQRAGLPPPLALCVVFPGASEEDVQRRVAGAARLELLEGRIEVEGLAERALARAVASLWPTSAAWAPIFDDLAEAGQARGAQVLLDGQGGDELLDAGYEAGRALALRPVALARWLRAERAYTGRVRRSAKILALDLLGRTPPRPAPAWLAPDLRESVEARFAVRPCDYAGVRAADVLDGTLAAQREETFDRGRRTGLVQHHPLWDPEVVALLDGLDPSALVSDGHPKAPGRAYLAQRVPAIPGLWPQPRVANLAAAAISEQLRARFETQGADLYTLQAFQILDSSLTDGLPNSDLWRTMSLDAWLKRALGREERGKDDCGDT
ncbi:MAG: hypothetical protein H0X39_01880 [Actinobacteria bacterium]|nr:hypothetical protein [Actinomycetota bacterium]